MAVSAGTFQAPKGTRDFYPPDMAVRRYLERTWRRTSIDYGFDEIDGPTFEHLELYTVKSGPQIVSELFSFRRAGGDVDYALRPEFTPTLARMYGAQAHSLPKPTKWFSICPFFRAERPQRGRLREHYQWNIDIIGDKTPAAEAEIVSVTVMILKRLGLTPDDVRIKISDRNLVSALLKHCGVDDADVPAAFALLDRRAKVPPEQFEKDAAGIGLNREHLELFKQQGLEQLGEVLGRGAAIQPLISLWSELESSGIDQWCEPDHGIVRGLAYYTGTVFEVHEAGGKERAIAGGGRYDNLVELFGGPPTPAVGIAMGDVVIRLVLEDRGLVESPEAFLPRPDVFLIAAGKEQAKRRFPAILQQLRGAGLHVRHSYRTTHNVGKLLGEAAKAQARCAVILGDELEDGMVAVKDLDSGDQRNVAVKSLAEELGATKGGGRP